MATLKMYYLLHKNILECYSDSIYAFSVPSVPSVLLSILSVLIICGVLCLFKRYGNPENVLLTS